MRKTKKKCIEIYNCDAKAYYVLCSYDTKNKIDEFFTQTKKYERTLTPVIINGGRVFSIYHYKSTLTASPTDMIILSERGAELFGNLCSDIEMDNAGISKVYRYLAHYINDEDNLHILKNMLPLIMKHFNMYKDSRYSPYRIGNMTNKYLCFFYPLFDDGLKGLISFLNEIHMKSDPEMQKSQISIY